MSWSRTWMARRRRRWRSEIAAKFPGPGDRRRRWTCGSDASLDALFQRAVLEFGGLDCLFYTAGAPPRFAPITDIRREDLQRQLEVHYIGAVAGDRPRGDDHAAAGARRIDRGIGVQGRGGAGQGGGRLWRQQGGAAAGAPGGGRRTGRRRHPGECHQRRSDRDAAVPAVREGAGAEPRHLGGRAAGAVQEAEPDGGVADSAGDRSRTSRCFWRAGSSATPPATSSRWMAGCRRRFRGSTRPAVERKLVTWTPPGATTPVAIVLNELFQPI